LATGASKLMSELEEYKNTQSQEIEDFLNKAREDINKECGCKVMPYKADVRFLRVKKK